MPTEAVRDPDGKEAVEALLLQWERHGEKDVSRNQIRPDISAIRRLLNLALGLPDSPSEAKEANHEVQGWGTVRGIFNRN